MRVIEPVKLSSDRVPAGQPPFFYGWVIVGCSFTVLSAAYGIQFSYGVFMPEISAEMGWGRTSLSLAYSVYVFVYSGLGIVAGLYTDRWGPRLVVGVGGVLLGSGVMLLSQVQALWQLYLFLGGIAALGMSAAFVPCNATVVRWFIRRRGLALSMSTSGSSFGNFFVPPLAALLITSYGWRTSYLLLGLGGLVLITLCACFIVRDPERLGLRPDGSQPVLLSEEALAGPYVSPDRRDAWTLASARRTVAFWMLVAAFTLTWLVVFMPLVHIVPFALDLGVSQVTAATLISVIGLAGFAGRLITGPLSDRCGRLLTLGTCLTLEAAAFFGLAVSSDLSLLYPSAALFGFSYGGTTALFPAIIGDFYGRLAVGAIVGFIFSLAGSMAAFGPMAAGYLYDVYGSYDLAFFMSAFCNLFGAVLLCFVKKPAALPQAV